MNQNQKFGKVLGELESEIMEIVWQSKEPIPVRKVTETLQRKRKIAYTTVMTIMGRLVDKGLLKRSSSDRAYTYQSIYSKDRFITKVARQIVKNFISNFGDAAVAHFAEEVEKLAPAKQKELKKLLRSKAK